MDREKLKRIIVEEILRALREMQIEETRRAEGAQRAQPGPVSGQRSEPAEDSAAQSSLGRGLVLFSGAQTPPPEVFNAIHGLTAQGAEFSAVLSLTFRQMQLAFNPGILGGIEVLPQVDDEAAQLRRAGEASWILAPSASLNTLNKLALSIEDSIPTRLLAAMLRSGKPCLFIESGDARGVGPGRSDLIRKLDRRGAILVEPDALLRTLREAMRPFEDRYYKAPKPRLETRHPIITKDDVYEGSLRGVSTLIVPADAIVTLEAHEDAARRGMTIKREGDS